MHVWDVPLYTGINAMKWERVQMEESAVIRALAHNIPGRKGKTNNGDEIGLS